MIAPSPYFACCITARLRRLDALFRERASGVGIGVADLTRSDPCQSSRICRFLSQSRMVGHSENATGYTGEVLRPVYPMGLFSLVVCELDAYGGSC
jgi:hypothetical protein